MKNDLKRSKLTASIIPLYVASWDGTTKNFISGITRSDSTAFKNAIDNQLGTDASFNFKDSFVNYQLGYILCVNTPALLNKFYGTGSLLPSDTIRFSKVLMPSEFIKKQNSLSSTYQLGEKINVRAGYEIIDGKQIIVYRDTNAKGRSRLKTGGGGAVAVWS